MNSILKQVGLTIVMLLLGAVLAPDVLAQCVQSAPAGSCPTCKPSTQGGCECSTHDCDNCLLLIACRKDAGTGNGGCPSDEFELSGVKLDESVIMEIAQRHPRFAAMLATVNNGGGLKSWASVSSFPARLDASEVENWLKPPAERRAFFREYRKRRVRGAKLLVYEFTLSKLDDTLAVIRGTVVEGFVDDPVSTELEIELVNSRVARWNLK